MGNLSSVFEKPIASGNKYSRAGTMDSLKQLEDREKFFKKL
jgi:hypothetical protein